LELGLSINVDARCKFTSPPPWFSPLEGEGGRERLVGRKEMKIMSIRRANNHKGLALVEFTLVFSLVFLPLVFGIIEFGWYMFVQHTLQFATRDGMRYGLVGKNLDGTSRAVADIKNRIVSKASSAAALSVGNISIKQGGTTYTDPSGWGETSTNQSGVYTKITTAYTYRSLTPIIGVLLNGKSVQVEVVYKNEPF
jgi:Flp pilus assembly protein TadG